MKHFKPATASERIMKEIDHTTENADRKMQGQFSIEEDEMLDQLDIFLKKPDAIEIMHRAGCFK